MVKTDPVLGINSGDIWDQRAPQRPIVSEDFINQGANPHSDWRALSATHGTTDHHHRKIMTVIMKNLWRRMAATLCLDITYIDWWLRCCGLHILQASDAWWIETLCEVEPCIKRLLPTRPTLFQKVAKYRKKWGTKKDNPLKWCACMVGFQTDVSWN